MKEDQLAVAKALSQAGKFDESEAILRHLAALDDLKFKYPATFNLGWHEMRKGNLLKGFTNLYVGRVMNVYGLPSIQTTKPIYQGGDLTGKRILLRGEGGFGDMMINFRFVRELKNLGAHITVSCPRQMFTLMRTIPEIDSIIDNEYAAGADHDCWLPCMSAVQALKIEYDSLDSSPYIPKPKKIPLAGDFKVGVRWGGNPNFEEELMRKLPADKMVELGNIAGVSLYSLQEGNDKIELPENVTDLSPLMTDWLATAQMVAGLDLVISSCTSVAHLAASMGIPTWVIVPILPYYIWAEPGKKSKWYDDVTLFRQTVPRSWDEPINEVRKSLEDKVNGRSKNIST